MQPRTGVRRSSFVKDSPNDSESALEVETHDDKDHYPVLRIR